MESEALQLAARGMDSTQSDVAWDCGFSFHRARSNHLWNMQFKIHYTRGATIEGSVGLVIASFQEFVYGPISTSARKIYYAALRSGVPDAYSRIILDAIEIAKARCEYNLSLNGMGELLPNGEWRKVAVFTYKTPQEGVAALRDLHDIWYSNILHEAQRLKVVVGVLAAERGNPVWFTHLSGLLSEFIEIYAAPTGGEL